MNTPTRTPSPTPRPHGAAAPSAPTPASAERRRPPRGGALWRTLLQGHRPLAWFALAMAVLALWCAAGALLDGRVVEGEPTWAKPFKFAVSFGLYAGTVAAMLAHVGRFRRTLWWLGTALVALFLVPEIAVITVQAARGVPSHFNVSGALDGTLYGIMGGAAYAGWLLTLALGVLLVLQRRADTAMTWAIGLGVLVSLAGMSTGYLMTAPTPEQIQAMESGAEVAMVGSHGVGGTGAGSMPVTGWETRQGDLRVAHFVGIHALQVLPLVAAGLLAAADRFPRLRLAGVRARLVVVAGLGYAGLGGLLLWQALRGQAPLAPDAATLLAAGALAAAVAAGVAAVLASPPRAAARS
ncbi:hypothetical protein HNR12_001573 [Streptomonospora nanhaiensis]|uniref:Uncharacterized protein n=1 Tax=Streptomonospora nanhaiensis TaxID=1323731 RepID=A0A853BL60_9ACTN|nr:hypothetical protein [Streptomonospora nanhaiensis]